MRVFGQYLSSAETAVLLVLLGLLLYRLFGRRKADGRGEATPALMDSSLPGEIAKLPTQWGDIYVRVFDPVKSGHRAEREEEKTPIVCLPGINSKLVDEWVPVAHALQQKGHFVLILNFHSNRNTTPALFFGGFSDDNVQVLLREAVMNGYFKSRHQQLVLFGKSWGGKQAMQFAITSPSLVKKLCLVAPATTDTALISALGKPLHPVSTEWQPPTNNYLPILLAWAKDDKALWFSNAKIWTDTLKSSQLKLVTADTGGHRILPEYLEPIISFVTQKQ